MIPGVSTGGGGLSYADTSNATSGPANSGVRQTIGGLNINTSSGWLWVVLAVLAAVVGWMLWKQFS